MSQLSTTSPVRPRGVARGGLLEGKSRRNGQEQLMDAVFAMFGAEELPEGVAQTTENPPWILSIDDDADFSDALKCRLEAHGVAVVRAYDGMEGYRMAFSHPSSAILLDYNMPNGQGDYVLRRLKENPVTADIPVIMITGVKDRNIERRVRNLGAVAYFEKPVRFEDLRSELSCHIDILTDPASPYEDLASESRG